MNEWVRGQSIYRVATALNAVTSCSSQTRAAPCSGACFIENSSPGGHSRYSASQRSVSAVLSNFHMYYFHWEREREGKCWIRAYNPAKLWHQSAEALNPSKQPWQWLTAAGDEERRQLRGRRIPPRNTAVIPAPGKRFDPEVKSRHVMMLQSHFYLQSFRGPCKFTILLLVIGSWSANTCKIQPVLLYPLMSTMTPASWALGLYGLHAHGAGDASGRRRTSIRSEGL